MQYSYVFKITVLFYVVTMFKKPLQNCEKNKGIGFLFRYSRKREKRGKKVLANCQVWGRTIDCKKKSVTAKVTNEEDPYTAQNYKIRLK